MTKFKLAIYFTVLTLSFIIPLKTYAADKLQTIRELGQLNGIALQCKYLQHTQQMKQALVSSLPKDRALGELFDSTTNKSFLGFINEGNSCPEESQFTTQVDAAISALQQAYEKH